MAKTLLEVFSGDEASKRGKNNRKRGLALERKVRDILNRVMRTETWRNPSTGSEIADVETRTGICPLCDGLGKLLLAVEVKSFQSAMPKWLERGVIQSEKAATQTGKTGVVIVTWKNGGKRRYFMLNELEEQEHADAPLQDAPETLT